MSKSSGLKILILSYRECFSYNTIMCLSHGQYEIIIGGNKEYHRFLTYDPRLNKFIDIPHDFVVDKHDKENCNVILEIVKNENVNIVMPSDFDSLKFLSRICNILEKYVDVIPIPNLQTIELLDDKYNSYLFLKNHGIESPKTILIGHNRLSQVIDQDISLPCLIKPRIGAGGLGIIKLSNKIQVKKYVDSLDKNNIKLNELLAQEYIYGLDYCFNGYAYNLPVTHKFSWTT